MLPTCFNLKAGDTVRKSTEMLVKSTTHSRALSPYCTSKSPGGLVTLTDLDTGWALRLCISNRLLGNAEAAGLGTKL